MPMNARLNALDEQVETVTVQTITLGLPQDIYQRLQRMAQATRQPVEEVMFQTIRGNLPPSLDDLPPEMRDDLAALQNRSDQALWAIARESLPPAQWRRHQHLLRKNQAGTLTGAERTELVRLRTTTDHFVLRRSYVMALLKWRGYTLPIQESLPPDAPTP